MSDSRKKTKGHCCCVCRNSSGIMVNGKKISLHRFPADKQVGNVWKSRIKLCSAERNSFVPKGVSFFTRRLVIISAMPLREYRRTAEDLEVTREMIDDFNEAGYIVVRNLVDADEVDKLKRQFETNEEFRSYIFSQTDGDHSKMKLCAWNYPGNDVTGMVVRSEKYAGTCEKLMGGEVYLYHSKVMMKEALSGGTILWHQDYGYWYKSGNLFPDMMTVFTAIDTCTPENGCLQVLEGSHKCGRIDHHQHGEQQEADTERVEHLLPKLERHYVQMEPGDAIFFHCNLLHRSERNASPQRRWAFANAFNMASNSSVIRAPPPSVQHTAQGAQFGDT